MRLFCIAVQKKQLGQMSSKLEEFNALRLCLLHETHFKRMRKKECKIKKYHKNGQIKQTNSGQ